MFGLFVVQSGRLDKHFVSVILRSRFFSLFSTRIKNDGALSSPFLYSVSFFFDLCNAPPLKKVFIELAAVPERPCWTKTRKVGGHHLAASFREPKSKLSK